MPPLVLLICAFGELPGQSHVHSAPFLFDRLFSCSGNGAIVGLTTRPSLATDKYRPRETPAISRAMGTAVGEQEMERASALINVSGVMSWDALRDRVLATATGAQLKREVDLRAVGEGPPHTDCTLRLFGRPESEIRVTLYRDAAAWCPYCQKVWMLFEDKRIPYKIAKINMRSYGDKPQWFLKKIPSGLLPVVEIDGQVGMSCGLLDSNVVCPCGGIVLVFPPPHPPTE